MTKAPETSQGYALIALIIVQSLCAVFFLNDTISDFSRSGSEAISDAHLLVETVASLVLFLGIVFEVKYLMQILRRQAHMARALTIASGALHDVMEGYFRSWSLTPAEQDVASFTMKGYSIAEVAELRGSAEGTVKAHLNAIYRKAGVAGRGALVSLIIEDLMNESLIDTDAIAAADGKKPSLSGQS